LKGGLVMIHKNLNSKEIKLINVINRDSNNSIIL